MKTLRLGAIAALIAGPAAALEIQDLTSPDGHAFWLVEEDAVPIVSVEIGFNTGSRLDPDDKAGLSNFTFALMDEGAGDMDAVAFSKRRDDISARIGFASRVDQVQASGQFLAESLDEGIDLMAIAMSAPRFDPEPVERVRKQILSGIAQEETEPGSIAQNTWWARAFPDHPYGRNAKGTIQTVQSFGPDDFRAAHQRLMTTANAFVTIVGPVDPERAGAIVDQLLKDLPKGEKIDRPRLTRVPPAGLHVVEQDVPQSVAVFGHGGLTRDDPDFFPAYVMNYVLGGGGFTSRLTEEVRVKRGLAYSVYSYLSVYNEAQLYMGGVQTANERIAESIEVIKAEWARMAEKGLTEEELRKAKTYLTGSFPLRFDSNAKIAKYLLFMQIEGLPKTYYDTRNSQIEAVTLEDTNRVAKRLLDPQALSVVVVGKPVGL